VTEYIGKIRHSLPGIDLISPPPHHDIYSIEDLAQLIYDAKNSNKEARISVKLVSKEGVGTVAAGVAKAHADMILISGHDGGTGASPLSSIKNAGIPWEIGLSETHQVLLMNNLRGKVSLQVDGQIKTARDVVVACLLGAEEFSFSTSMLVTLGCIMCRNCHKNQCPVGIATQDLNLRKKFKGKPEYSVNYMRFLAKEVREYMADLGFRNINEMVGRIDKLKKKTEINSMKAEKIDFSKILYKPDLPSRVKTYKSVNQNHNLDQSLDNKLIEKSKSFFIDRKKVEGSFEINNTNRSVGALLSSKIIKSFPGEKIKEDTLIFKFYGTAGQSFGTFTVSGVTLKLEGDANDFMAKGLSGGKIIIKKPENNDYGKSIIAGNTILYGATGGEAYINGVVGERFAVRNSGALAVVEGVGNHGCEYMTAGVVVILGDVGKNFAAGMSGGIALVFDNEDKLKNHCNSELVSIENLNKIDLEKLVLILKKHTKYTESNVSREMLDNWDKYSKAFKKVIPVKYKEALKEKDRYERVYKV
jgi:glutamate synthase (NADPH/NADH) large chain